MNVDVSGKGHNDNKGSRGPAPRPSPTTNQDRPALASSHGLEDRGHFEHAPSPRTALEEGEEKAVALFGLVAADEACANCCRVARPHQCCVASHSNSVERIPASIRDSGWHELWARDVALLAERSHLLVITFFVVDILRLVLAV